MTGDVPARRSMCTHLTLGVLSLLMLLPVLWSLSSSVKPREELYGLSVLSARSTLDSYRAALETFPLASLLWNTTLMAAGVALGQLLLALLTAFALTRFRFAGSNVVFGLMVATILIPQQVLIVPNYILAAELGWVDNYLGLVIPQVATAAFGVFLLRQHMRSFPQSLLDAAEIDGATHREVLWRVIVPNLRPAISALGILFFVGSWNEYLWPLLVAQAADRATVQVGLQAFLGEQGTAWGELMAASTLSTLPVLLVYLIAQRRVLDAFLRAGVR